MVHCVLHPPFGLHPLILRSEDEDDVPLHTVMSLFLFIAPGNQHRNLPSSDSSPSGRRSVAAMLSAFFETKEMVISLKTW